MANADIGGFSQTISDDYRPGKLLAFSLTSEEALILMILLDAAF